MKRLLGWLTRRNELACLFVAVAAGCPVVLAGTEKEQWPTCSST